jgi:hypothetical protein
LLHFPPLWYHYIMVPIAYVFNALSTVISPGTIPMASLPSELNFYPAFNIISVPGWLFNSVVKFPFLISDIFVALLLYKIVSQVTNKKNLAEKAVLLWFLNPFVIWISAVWGMWDTLPVFFSLASLYFVLNRRYKFSAIILSLGVACKLYPFLFLLPLLLYIKKSSTDEKKLKNGLTFITVFSALTVLLFLPYYGWIINFFKGYFIPVSLTSTPITDQIDNPVGFGLTYWALGLLSRVFNITVISNVTIYYESIFSSLLFIVFLVFTFYRIRKMNFQKPAYDLALIMLAPLGVLFLTYRIICEQFFIWLIPFLIILFIAGRVKYTLFWGLSLVAFFYAIINCPFPFFFLPLAPLFPDTLLNLVHFTLSFEPLRISLLAILGCCFSVLLIILFYEIRNKKLMC